MNKYNAIKTVVDGITFDSKKEARRYSELKLLERAKEIICLELQPRLDIVVNGTKVCFYKGDFRYYDVVDKSFVIEDVKGCKKGGAYAMFRLKKKLVKACYNIDIVEI